MPGNNILSLLTLNKGFKRLIKNSPQLNIIYLQWMILQIPRYQEKREKEIRASIMKLETRLAESKKSFNCSIEPSKGPKDRGIFTGICCTLSGSFCNFTTCITQCCNNCSCCNPFCIAGSACGKGAFGASCSWGTCYPAAPACITGYACLGVGVLALTYTAFQNCSLDCNYQYSLTSCCIKHQISKQTSILERGISEECNVLEERLLLKISFFMKKLKQVLPVVPEEKRGKQKVNASEHVGLLVKPG